MSLPDGTFYVYVYPAQTRRDVIPLGGDERFLMSADGKTILARRRMHRAIIEWSPRQNGPNGSKLVSGFHTAILDDIPEDTDVFYVLARTPRIPEYVGAKGQMYLIHEDGSIEYRGSAP